MKTFYYLILPLAVLLSASSAQAGSPGKHRDGHGPHMEKRMERLAEKLDLSSEQSEQLQAIMEAAAAERDALREKYAAQIKPELCSLQLATMEQVREILTPEQAEALEGRLERWVATDVSGGGRHRGQGQDCEASG